MKVLVLGATGETGQELVRAAASDPKIAVKVISRKPVDSVEAIVYDDLARATKEDFSNIDAVYCSLGTTRGTAGSAEAFVRIDHDLVLELAGKAKAAGVRQWHYISSAGADADSWLLYPKTKGRTESDLRSCGFEDLVIYRPGLLLCDRKEQRLGESIARGIFGPVAEWCCPGRLAISTRNLAAAAVLKSKTLFAAAAGPGPRHSVEILGNRDIYQMTQSND